MKDSEIDMAKTLTHFLVTFIALATLVGCGQKVPEAKVISDNLDFVDLEGGLGLTGDGRIISLSNGAQRTQAPAGDAYAFTVVDGETFILARTDEATLVFDGNGRTVWRGVGFPADIGPSATDRLFIAIDSTLISIDPAGPENQIPNEIERFESPITSIALLAGLQSWIATLNGAIRPLGGATGGSFPEFSSISGLVARGNEELVACDISSGTLERFYVNNSTEVVKGRTLATNCTGGVSVDNTGRVLATTAEGVIAI
jgi:hypothetical protein